MPNKLQEAMDDEDRKFVIKAFEKHREVHLLQGDGQLRLIFKDPDSMRRAANGLLEVAEKWEKGEVFNEM